jgi:uncharacterized membrane protein
VKNSKKPNPFVVFTGIGFEIVALLVAAIYGGQLIDQHWPSNGLWTVVFILLAMVGWMVHVFYLLKGLNRD